ncbi:MAG: thioredoxin fold domain-containing protein [Calditrichaceae bacterium]
MKKLMFIFLISCHIMLLASCNKDNNRSESSEKATVKPSVTEQLSQIKTAEGTTEALITFVELGSVNCVPCKKMQPVMKAVEEKYGSQIKVIFYDVWQKDQNKYADQYGIRLIPTQVFLDAEGNEIARHEGFFPETEIDQLLQQQGLKPLYVN